MNVDLATTTLKVLVALFLIALLMWATPKAN